MFVILTIERTKWKKKQKIEKSFFTQWKFSKTYNKSRASYKNGKYIIKINFHLLIAIRHRQKCFNKYV